MPNAWAALLLGGALAAGVMLRSPHADACSPPSPDPTTWDWGPEEVPREGVFVVDIDRASAGMTVFVFDSEGASVDGRTQVLGRGYLVWNADEALESGADYQATSNRGGELLSFRAADEPAPGPAAAEILSARLTETAVTAESCCEPDSCPARCEAIEYEYRPAIELVWHTGEQSLDPRYLAYRWVEPLEDGSFGGGPFEHSTPTGERTSLVPFREPAEQYCIALQVRSFVDGEAVRTEEICLDHDDLEPVPHDQPERPPWCPDADDDPPAPDAGPGWPDAGARNGAGGGGGGCAAAQALAGGGPSAVLIFALSLVSRFRGRSRPRSRS